MAMRASEQSSTGGVGVTEVAGLFERIGWAPLENRDRHDLGTDLLVAARDLRRFDRGVLVGVQVKGGRSWFSEPVIGGSDEIAGWWHRNDSEHFDYWVKHQLPHLIVLYDIDKRVGYWVHVTSERCESTGQGCKIFVPITNTICDNDAQRLLEIALSQRGSISLEGTSFDAASAQIPPGDRLRYALLIPRLIAPHRNRTLRRALEPEEAVALLVLMQVPQLTDYIDKSRDWPKLEERPLNKDWRWQFAFTLWRFVAYGDKSGLMALHSDAVREDWRAASAVLLAAAGLQIDKPREGASWIFAEVERDKAGPVDHAWLHLHASRLAFEAHLREKATSHVSQAIKLLAGISDDPTASLLSGIAYRTRYNLVSWKEIGANMSDTLRAGDNAGSWWRDQQLRWALDSAAVSQFHEWAQDTSSRWEAEPPMQQLVPSMLMALFSADRMALSAAEARLGRFGVQCAKTDDEFRSAFARLLSSGDKSSVVLAGRRAWRYGPAQVLADCSAVCVPENFSPGRIGAFLEFWHAFGDLGTTAAAEEVVAWCLSRVIEEKVDDDAPRTASLLDAIKGALAACSDQVRQEVAAGIHAIPAHRTHSSELCSVVEELERLAPGCLNADFIVKMADREPEHAEQTRLLGISAKLGSDIARTRLLDDSAKGNLLAAAIALEVGALTAETAEIVSQELMKLLQQEQSDSAKGRFGFRYSVDRCLLMAALSLSFPSIARWKEIMLYIGDSAVIADHKVASIYRIIRDLSKLPDDAKQLLQMQVPGLRVSRYRPVNLFEGWAERRSATGLADFVHFGINGRSNSGLEEFVSSALSLTGADRHVAWQVLLKHRLPGYDLLALQSLGDGDPFIRDAATRFIARRVEDGADTPTLRRALERSCADGSVLAPRAVVTEIAGRCPAWVRASIESLRHHPSAAVRNSASGVLRKSF